MDIMSIRGVFAGASGQGDVLDLGFSFARTLAIWCDGAPAQRRETNSWL